ncbi:MAG TPA: electron transfer flavoprotein-ubiquinone oxidoreductase, partial [bacterium]|nr:electron transfer flavoprotein-ubiquinone oxidoreductase [bacterium]
GDHSLSGASLDVKALAELFPEFEIQMGLLGPRVSGEGISFLTGKRRLPFPFVPPGMSNDGCYVVSLSEFVKWLASECEKEGVEIYAGEPADELIFDESNAVCGVVVKEKGLDKEGKRKPNFLEPTEVKAKVTVLGEGSRGHLTKVLTARLGLDEGSTPQGHAVGIKELWEVPEERFSPGRIAHTMGWPLRLREFGGGFAYHHRDKLVALGLVVGLDYGDPRLNAFDELQRFKSHPFIRPMIEGGKLISYGARTISEGGWYCLPRLYGDGFLIIGEGAGFLNPMRLKGIHLSMKSGMLAAETIFDAIVKKDFSSRSLSAFKERVDVSWIKDELWRTRNFHQGFHRGLLPGMVHAALQFPTFGRGLIDKMKVKKDSTSMRVMKRFRGKRASFEPDGRVTYDKLTCVFASGTKHEEDQPCHLRIADPSICNGRCAQEYGNPCRFFCPANVYEMVENEEGKRVLQINPTNCLHCKTCDVKDPYDIITWVPPEGGGGPNYKGM